MTYDYHLSFMVGGKNGQTYYSRTVSLAAPLTKGRLAAVVQALRDQEGVKPAQGLVLLGIFQFAPEAEEP